MDDATQPGPPPVDPALIARTAVPFVRSVRHLFKTMLGLTATVGRTRVRRDDASLSYDVTSIIGFGGELLGTALVGLDRAAAARLVAAFTGGGELAADDPDFADAVGELANMIVGGAKNDFGARASITCPRIVLGAGRPVPRLAGVPCLVIPCSTPAGDFTIEVNVRPAAAAAKLAA